MIGTLTSDLVVVQVAVAAVAAVGLEIAAKELLSD